MSKRQPWAPGPGADDARPDEAEGGGWPGLPEATRNYLAHTEGGRTIRAIARDAQVAPSTILRQVRRVESSREDPLLDAGLRGIAGGAEGDDAFARDALPVLRRLAEPGAVLAVARDMEKGVVVREGPEGEARRLAVVERRLAEAMAVRGWIACAEPQARISRYRITAAGRAELRSRPGGLPAPAARPQGLAEARAAFEPAPREEDGRLRHMRSLLAETPLAALARRRTSDGAPFLPRDLVLAGERLREDFEHARLGMLPSWEAVVAAVGEGGVPPAALAARRRIGAALDELGPGLADVCVSCCCLLEGLESVERRLGWSARSGKVVLRIALDRLSRFQRNSEDGAMIG